MEFLRSPVHLRLLLAGCAVNTLPALSGPSVGCIRTQTFFVTLFVSIYGFLLVISLFSCFLRFWGSDELCWAVPRPQHCMPVTPESSAVSWTYVNHCQSVSIRSIVSTVLKWVCVKYIRLVTRVVDYSKCFIFHTADFRGGGLGHRITFGCSEVLPSEMLRMFRMVGFHYQDAASASVIMYHFGTGKLLALVQLCIFTLFGLYAFIQVFSKSSWGMGWS